MEAKSPQPSTAKATGAPSTLLARDIEPADIIWIDMPKAHVVGSEEEKTRPWVVVSSSRFNKGALGLVVAVPLSRQLKMADITLPGRVRIDNQKITFQDKHLPDHLKLERADKVALCDHVRSLSEKRILGRAGTVQRRVLDDIRAGIAFDLDLAL